MSKKELIIRLIDKGATTRAIAKQAKCSPDYVYNVRSAHRKVGQMQHELATVWGDALFTKEEVLSSPPEPTGSILDEARGIIYGDREKTYGNPGKNLTLIGKLWGDYLGVTIDPNDVCLMMIMLKAARLKNDPMHRDGMVDIAGYAALMERAQKEAK